MVLAVFASNGQPDIVGGVLVLLTACSAALTINSIRVPRAVRRRAQAIDKEIPEEVLQFWRRCLRAGLAGLALAAVIGVVYALT